MGHMSLAGPLPLPSGCRRIFVADPAKRMSIQEMQRHPWYQQDLPPGLTGFNDICLAQQRASGMVGSQSEDQIKVIVQVWRP